MITSRHGRKATTVSSSRFLIILKDLFYIRLQSICSWGVFSACVLYQVSTYASID